MYKFRLFSITTLIIFLVSFSVFSFSQITLADNGINVKVLGAKGDGVTDDTNAIQTALDQNENIFIPDGTYLINVDQSLQPKSDQTITLSDNAILKAIPTSSEYNAVIRIDDVSDITIAGGQIVGERDEHNGSTGQWGMGIMIIDGSSKVSISNIIISNFWGDGVYLGGSSAVSNITADKITCDNNRRLGLAVTNATHVTINNCVMKNSVGTPPAGGIDIEPNKNGIAEDILITNTECFGNYGSGIDVLGTSESISIKRIEIKDSVLKDNSGDGIRLINASKLSLNGVTILNNNFGIDIPRDVYNLTVTNSTISKNRYAGLSIASTEQQQGIDNITFENSVFSNNSQNQANKFDGVRIDLYDASGYISNIQFKNVQFIDDQAFPTQRYGLSIVDSTRITGITTDSNCSFSGNISGDTNKEKTDIFDQLNIKPLLKSMIHTIKSWLNLT